MPSQSRCGTPGFFLCLQLRRQAEEVFDLLRRIVEELQEIPALEVHAVPQAQAAFMTATAFSTSSIGMFSAGTSLTLPWAVSTRTPLANALGEHVAGALFRLDANHEALGR